MKSAIMKNKISFRTTADLLEKIVESYKRLCECERLLKIKGQQLHIPITWHEACKDEEQQGEAK